MQEVRITVAVARVLRVFLGDPARARHGYDLMQVTGYPSGKLYPILARLARAGILLRDPEDIDPARAGRPARFLYRLSEDGTQAARQELAVLSQQLGPPGPAQARRRPESRLS